MMQLIFLLIGQLQVNYMEEDLNCVFNKRCFWELEDGACLKHLALNLKFAI